MLEILQNFSSRNIPFMKKISSLVKRYVHDKISKRRSLEIGAAHPHPKEKVEYPSKRRFTSTQIIIWYNYDYTIGKY